MAIQSKCGFCQGTRFETKTEDVGSNFVVVFVRCAQCGAVAGTLDKMPTGEVWAEIQKIKQAIGVS